MIDSRCGLHCTTCTYKEALRVRRLYRDKRTPVPRSLPCGAVLSGKRLLPLRRMSGTAL